MRKITFDINKAFGTSYNTILINKYKGNSNDCINKHHDKTDNWKEGSGLVILSFGATRELNF